MAQNHQYGLDRPSWIGWRRALGKRVSGTVFDFRRNA